MKRMWINQPSTNQPLHHLHGTRVLWDGNRTIYFVEGDVISQGVPDLSVLSPGWDGATSYCEEAGR
ncbi:MAG: hypothetical protein EOM24_29965 [Chloroflexia bacterium]|nr:hypothetical protein [Chloroflexia bacterium]